MAGSSDVIRDLVRTIIKESDTTDPSHFGWKKGSPNKNIYRHPDLLGHTLHMNGDGWSHNIGYGSTLSKSIGSGKGEKSLSNHLIAFHNKGWDD
jgi:hypothetical protein